MIWNQNVRAKAQRLLERRIQLGNQIQFMFESELIQNELGLIGEFDSQSTLFVMTINEAIQENNTSLDDFESAFERRINFHNETWTYDIYLPLYLNFPKRKFKIQDTEILKIPFKNIYTIFSKDNLITALIRNGVSNFGDNNIPKYALKFSVEANNKFEAWKKVDSHYNLLRGIIDYSILYNQINYTFGRGSRTKNHHPQWALMHIAARPTSEFITFQVEKDPRIGDSTWNKNQTKTFKKLLTQLISKQEEDKTVNILADSLRLYAQAMESIHNHNCFLSLWQLAESLTRSDTFNGQTKIVLSRLAWHYSTANTAIRGLDVMNSINELPNKRNKIVHKDIDRIQNTDINLLKSLCDLGIKWLSEQTKQLKTTNHLDEFYRLRTSPEKQRKAIIETVRSL